MFSLEMLLDPRIILKIITLIVIFVYAAFALIMLNQVRTMNRIVSYEPLTMLLALIAVVHFIAVISLFLATVVIL